MKDFWNERYRAEDFIYGTKPNAFFRTQLEKLSPGHLLLPAEGEGRNAVFAAQSGWSVEAFDISEVGRKKALKLASDAGVQINYQVGDLDAQAYDPASFDAIGLIFAHLPPPFKELHYSQFPLLLKEGGKILLEVFSKKHLAYQSRHPRIGGPGNEEMLFSLEEVQTFFNGLTFELLEEREIELAEGSYHVGCGSVVRCIASKPMTKIG